MRLLNKVKVGMGLVCLFIISFLSANEPAIRMQILQGDMSHARVKDITALSLIIYREYPYLYEGTEEEYLPLIQLYAQSDQSIACILLENEKPIGVAIGMPMNAMRANYQQPLLNCSEKPEMDKIFYLGEFLLLKEYRGKGLGKRMYSAFERLVKEKGGFTSLCFCKISEFDNHPQMPVNYKSLDGFWMKRGFKQLENVNLVVYWRDVNEIEDRSHKLVYWMKPLLTNL